MPAARGETSALLPNSNSNGSGRAASDSAGRKRALSRTERSNEVTQSPEVASGGNGESGSHMPASSIDPATSSHLHDPRWAEYDGPANLWARTRYVWREELAECLGTAMIILFGASTQCQTVLHYTESSGKPYPAGDWNTAAFAWSLGVAAGVWVCGGVSGGHLNPAVTIALWLYRGFPTSKVLTFITAQVTGAMMATFVVYTNYYSAIALHEGGGIDNGVASSLRTVTGAHATAGLFITSPKPWLPAFSAFMAEAIATGALVLMIFALTDKANMAAPKGIMPMAVFLVVLGIASSMGVNTGYALNGARDGGPRIALWLLGYGGKVWTHNGAYWIWGPWAGTITGGVVAGFIYDVFVYTGKDSWVNRPLGGYSNPKTADAARRDAELI